VININVNGRRESDEELARAIYRELLRRLRRNPTLGFT
jgi:hypothetical protein